ncbi:MAG TPA: beta-N-acetylhexosaminidase, partial [Gemmatimonadaceae bacterium]|nr:beta-N-acetylhexosaminidase [Gemmatimonadaceae bacterium]
RPAPQPAGPRAIQTPPPLTTLAEHHVVPVPVSVTPAEGASFALTAATIIVVPVPDASAEAARVGEALGALLRPATGFRLPVVASDGPAPRGAIVLRRGADSLGQEGYDLLVTADSVRLAAATPGGLFRGVQTLRQLLPAGIEAEQSAMQMASAWTVPPGRIVDWPRYTWRGGMLDVARHFFTVDEVKQYIDLLALYKLNTLHLHLSDDQGWRIQIDAWPKLATVGGSTEVGGGPGGFYTKRDYADIVQYARERFITVVPEIDMPGHTNAAIAAYPELGCSRPTPSVYAGAPGDSQPPGLYTGITVGWSTLCPDKELTYRFVDEVLGELAAMTPGPYLHVGGDEVAALTDSQYAGFVERVQEIVARHGKTMVGWEEVGKARLRPTTIAQLWRGDTALLAARQGARLILSPGPKAYIDMKYTPATELGLRWAGFLEVRTVYDWDPATYVAGVSPENVLGVEAPLWTETVQNITAAEFLLVPRLPALAEVGWSAPGRRSWEGFRARIAAHAPRWRLLGVNFYPSPQVAW